jgi:hypothetical protein
LDPEKNRNKSPDKHARTNSILEEFNKHPDPLVRLDNIDRVHVCYTDDFERRFLDWEKGHD